MLGDQIIWAIQFTEPVSQMIREDALFNMSVEKRNRLSACRRSEDLDRSILADICVRIQVSRSVGIPVTNQRFDINSFGKPYLRGVNDFHFNVSHSGEWVVCIFDKKIVGIDVEEIRPIDVQIAQLFCSPLEYEAITLIPNEHERLRKFYETWTLKESYVKAIGTGLSTSIQQVNFSTASRHVYKYTSTLPMYGIHHEINERYKLCVCSFHQSSVPLIRIGSAKLCEIWIQEKSISSNGG